MQAKKEISVAIIIGLIIGGIIIGGIYRAKQALDNHLSKTPSGSQSTPVPSLSPTSQDSLPLTITTPQDESITDLPTVELSGITKKDTYVTILTEKNEYIIVPSDTGNFSQEISLVKGANTITIAVYTPEGDKTEKTLNIVYTTAEL